MTNPNNAIGTNGAYNGRTSVEVFNDVLNEFYEGIVTGWECSPSSGMTITLGGVTGYRDIAIATAPGRARTLVVNRSSQPVEVTIDAAPASNSRIDVIVAYVSNPPQGTTELVDNPEACGLIVVKGTVSSSPTAPTNAMIRSAITADGAAGSTAYYVVLATVQVVAGMTTITSNYITQGSVSQLPAKRITAGAVNTEKIANKAVTADKIDFTTSVVAITSGIAKATYFQGETSTTFTVPVAGTYLFVDCFTGVFHRVASANNVLKVNVDDSTIIQYAYCSVSGDTEWGTTRRTISGASRAITLTAGSHTLKTSGNLYYDDSYLGPTYHQIYLIRVA